jgi:SulP family sulfate permease
MVGEIPSRLPPLSSPDLSPAMIRLLAPEAVAVAILGLVEAVSISRAIAVKSDQKIDACQEFIGQGVSNIAGSFFSSYAGSGSFTRSGVNYEAGARTPLSAVFAALFLGAVVLVVAPLAAFLPVSAMGGVILLVAYNLIDFQYVAGLLRCSKVETVVFGVTFTATLLLELEFAVFLGVFISIAFVLAKTAVPNVPVISVDQTDPHRTLVDVESRLVRQCPQLRMIRVDGPVYFGSINHIQNRIRHIVEKEKVYNILVICSGVGFMDLNGEEVLIKESDNVKRLGGGLFFSGLRSDVYEFAVQSGFIRQIGPNNFFDSKEQALHEVYSRMDGEKCRTCRKGVFLECDAECRSRSRSGPGLWEAKTVKPVMLVPAGERK